MPPKNVKTTETVEVMDFSDIKPFEPLDPTILYKSLVTVCKKNTSGKTPSYHTEFTITAPETVDGVVGITTDKTGNTVNAKNRKVMKEFYLTPKAKVFLYEFIKACNPEADLTVKNFKMNGADYEGSEVCITIENKESSKDSAKFYPNLKRVLPITAWK